jgi:hypothetical protein
MRAQQWLDGLIRLNTYEPLPNPRALRTSTGLPDAIAPPQHCTSASMSFADCHWIPAVCIPHSSPCLAFALRDAALEYIIATATRASKNVLPVSKPLTGDHLDFGKRASEMASKTATALLRMQITWIQFTTSLPGCNPSTVNSAFHRIPPFPYHP